MTSAGLQNQDGVPILAAVSRLNNAMVLPALSTQGNDSVFVGEDAVNQDVLWKVLIQ